MLVRRLFDYAGRALIFVGRTLRCVGVPRGIWIDVGAHLGEYTLWAARASPALKVYAFEPNLRVAAKRLGRFANFVVIPMAVAEEDGCADFHVNRLDDSSSLLPYNQERLEQWVGGEVLGVEATITVPTIRLDTFLDAMGIDRVDYLKIDAQGMDLPVVRSLGKHIGKVKKICLEVVTTSTPLYEGQDSRESVVQYLENAGFVLAGSEIQTHGQEENLTFVQRRDGMKQQKSRWRGAQSS